MHFLAAERAGSTHVVAPSQTHQRSPSGCRIDLISSHQLLQLPRHETAQGSSVSCGEHPGVPGQIRIDLDRDVCTVHLVAVPLCSPCTRAAQISWCTVYVPQRIYGNRLPSSRDRARIVKDGRHCRLRRSERDGLSDRRPVRGRSASAVGSRRWFRLAPCRCRLLEDMINIAGTASFGSTPVRGPHAACIRSKLVFHPRRQAASPPRYARRSSALAMTRSAGPSMRCRPLSWT